MQAGRPQLCEEQCCMELCTVGRPRCLRHTLLNVRACVVTGVHEP